MGDPRAFHYASSITICAALILTLPGCSRIPGTSAYAIDEAENVVSGQMIDPDSAKFRSVRHYRSTGAVCGEVNSKNRMGGYVGFRRFVVHDGNAKLDSSDDTPPMDDVDALNHSVDQARFSSDVAEFCTDLKPPSTSPRTVME